MIELSILDLYLPVTLRMEIEQHYYAQINAKASLEALFRDPEFVRDPASHVGLYADHGVVHVRDVAMQIVQVLDSIEGGLIDARPTPDRHRLLRGYGVVLAYLHDIGMLDGSHYGRRMHPEFVAQLVFRTEFDSMLGAIWQADCGGLSTRLTTLAQRGLLRVLPQVALRELLVLAMAHSKSKVAARLLDDCVALRAVLQYAIQTDLLVQYQRQQAERGQHNSTQNYTARVVGGTIAHSVPIQDTQHPASTAQLHQQLRQMYVDFSQESFHWLIDPHPDLRSLADDAIDTVRALRCADALRQRGSVLKTSGAYEMLIDQQTAQVIYALRSGESQLYLLAASDPMASGEANIASIELDRDSSLRISFHRGSFHSPEAVDWAAYCAAMVIDDVQSDVLGSFPAHPQRSGLRNESDSRLLLESTNDNPAFASKVIDYLLTRRPTLQGRIEVAPSLHAADQHERARYLDALPLRWTIDQREQLLAAVAQAGHNTAPIDPTMAFSHVRLITLQPDELLLAAGASADFVYIPLGDGLRITPLGGYTSFSVQAWMPLGITGVIRGAARNATIRAECSINLLVIPKEIYLRYWHHPYTAADLITRLTADLG